MILHLIFNPEMLENCLNIYQEKDIIVLLSPINVSCPEKVAVYALCDVDNAIRIDMKQLVQLTQQYSQICSW